MSQASTENQHPNGVVTYDAGTTYGPGATGQWILGERTVTVATGTMSRGGWIVPSPIEFFAHIEKKKATVEIGTLTRTELLGLPALLL